MILIISTAALVLGLVLIGVGKLLNRGVYIPMTEQEKLEDWNRRVREDRDA